MALRVARENRDLIIGIKARIKGVAEEYSELLEAAGVDAIQVSSHGSRQLDSAPAPISALADIRAALGNDYPLFYDTGLRSGEDVVKAFSQGANFTFLGRILQFAIAAAGEEGLHAFWDVLKAETSITLAQIGKTSL